MLDERIRADVERSAQPVTLDEVIARAAAADSRSLMWRRRRLALAFAAGVAAIAFVVSKPGDTSVSSVAAAPPASISPHGWSDLSDQFAAVVGGDATVVLDIVDTGSELVAVGGEFEMVAGVRRNAIGALWRSADGGDTWRRHPTGDVADGNDPWHGLLLHGLDEVESTSVLFGLPLGSVDQPTALFTSADLELWQRLDLSAEVGLRRPVLGGSVVFDGELLLWATEGDVGPGSLFSTTDLTGWTKVTAAGLPQTLHRAGLQANDDQIVLLAEEGGLWFSEDGRTWNLATVEDAPVAGVRPILLSSGPSGHALGGITPVESPPGPSSADDSFAIAWMGWWSSGDGETWELVTQREGISGSTFPLEAHSLGFGFTEFVDGQPTLVDVRRGVETRSELPIDEEPTFLTEVDGRWFVAGTNDGPAQVLVSSR